MQYAITETRRIKEKGVVYLVQEVTFRMHSIPDLALFSKIFKIENAAACFFNYSKLSQSQISDISLLSK